MKKSILDLLNIELKHSATGTLSPIGATTAIENSYRAISVKRSALDSEFKALSIPYLPLQTVRAQLMRGKLAEAETHIKDISRQFESDSVLKTEFLLEQSRLFYQQSKWIESLRAVNEALLLAPTPVTSLSLLQVRSACWFELGEFKKALSDVELILSQRSYYPFAVAVFYAQTLLIKLLARTGEAQSSSEKLSALWNSLLSESKINLDQLLTLLRLELDLKRLKLETTSQEALACLRVSQIIGDRLYEGLAILDLNVCGVKEVETQFKPKLDSSIHEFSRVKNLWAEVMSNSTEGSSISGIEIQSYLKQEKINISLNQSDCSSLDSINSLVLTKFNYVIHLDSLDCIDFRRHPQAQKFLKAFCNGSSFSKEEMFKTVWDIGRFVPHLHEEALRSLVRRVRRDLKIQVLSEADNLVLKNSLVI